MAFNWIDAAALRQTLSSGSELALVDVREEGAFSKGHLYAAICVPLSHLELRVDHLVPRLDCTLVLCDAGDNDCDLAQRAAAVCASFGYSDISILRAGVEGWREAGFEVFSGVNVPSKAFGEFVEHWYDTPRLEASEVIRRKEQGEKLVILDSRPMAEFNRMSIPGGLDCPGAELVYRVDQVVNDPQTTVIVNCAGRTRSIIGAQSLINAGLENPVFALKDGTMGWELAGYEVARGETTHAPDPIGDALDRARQRAASVSDRFGVQYIDASVLSAWRKDAARTTYLLDVRTEAEFLAGHWPGARHAPGGQLVQATDEYVGIRNARIVLADSADGVRGTMTAHWLVQLGWADVAVLNADPVEPEVGPTPAKMREWPKQPTIEVSELVDTTDDGTIVIVDLATSLQYRAGHIPGAWWGVRARLANDLAHHALKPKTVILTAPDERLAQLAANDLSASYSVKVLAGGTQAFANAGHSLASGLEHMLTDFDDVWWKPYDYKESHPERVRQAMEDYLTWEVGLVEQLERDGSAGFKRF